MKDQFNRNIPKDLVVLDLNPTIVGQSGITIIENAPWYLYKNIILVSYKAIKGLTETDPLDCDIDLNNIDIDDPIMYVHDALKRWSSLDGFYTA